MSLTMIAGLAGFAFVTSITPGPNNMMLLASGANFGLWRTLPHMLGVALGFGAMILLIGLGLDRIIRDHPLLHAVLTVGSLAYVLWLAWKIARAGAPEAAAGIQPMSFLAACAFQWVNPKAWAMALGALVAYEAMPGGAALIAAVFVAINLPSVAVWAAAGEVLRGWLAEPARLQVFNVTMALLLVVSMLPVLAGMG